MTEQGGALAELRRAIRDLHDEEMSVCALAIAGADEGMMAAARARRSTAGNRIDAALTAAEARIGRLVRFVRARDAIDAGLRGAGTGEEFDAAIAELDAARAALTAEDVA